MDELDRWYGYPPEERLLGEIISQALMDLQKSTYREQAWRYFISKDTSYDTSFLSICKTLNIDEDNILVLVKKHYLSGRPLTTNVVKESPEVF